MATKLWYPRTCSENHGCILELTDSVTLGGISKTCYGHSDSADFGRPIGIPQFTGLAHNAPITGDEAVFDAILAQNQAGTQETISAGFTVFDEMRIGDTSALGMEQILWAYESSMIAPGDTRFSPPNTTFLNTYFAGLKSANPTVNRLVLDYEAWVAIDNNGVYTTELNYYITLVNAAKAHFSNVGLYGTIPQRYTLYLNYAIGHATYISRRNGWFNRCSQAQSLFDAVDTVYPSCYFVNPVWENIDDWNNWIEDHKIIGDTYAPGKQMFPVVWFRRHESSVPDSEPDQNPYMPGTYWRNSIDKVYQVFTNTGMVLWEMSSKPDPRDVVPIPDCWTETESFMNALP